MKLSTCLLLTMAVGMIQIDQSRANNSTDTLYASALHPYGRYRLNERKEIELISSAVHVGFTFHGEQCAVYASNKDEHQHNYIQYELDGVYQRRLRIDGHPTAPILITATGKGVHTIWIYKATEAHTGPVVLAKIVANHIEPLSPAPAPLIEFIGNSITCGAASDTSDFPCGAGEYHDHHNAYMAYGPRVARALKANYILSSVSGIGIYRTWNMDGPSMPQVYEHIDFQLNNPEKWDFKKYSPKIVSIALGTNDLSNGDGKNPRAPFDKQVFITDYVGFIKLVKTKYPKAQIVLLSSPMVKGNAREVLENCLTTIKSQVDAAYPSDKALELFFFPPMDAHGCYGHPSVEDHKILAAELQPFFQKLLSQYSSHDPATMHKPTAKPRMITVDDYPVTQKMFGSYTGREYKSGPVRSVDKRWFTNSKLGQTLVFELYTDNFRNVIFHFANDDIPAGLIDRMELNLGDGDTAATRQKEKYFKGFLRYAREIDQRYFRSDKGLVMGDSTDKAIRIYGQPDKRYRDRGVDIWEWTFVGETLYDGKTSLKGKPLARDSFGYSVTLFFRVNRLIGLILDNDIP